MKLLTRFSSKLIIEFGPFVCQLRATDRYIDRHIEFYIKKSSSFWTSCYIFCPQIRDGRYGYSKLVNRYCGESFPPTVTSTGPYLWLRFRSDENIEYEGFRISVGVEPSNRISKCFIFFVAFFLLLDKQITRICRKVWILMNIKDLMMVSKVLLELFIETKKKSTAGLISM